jgi:hypothetical protein
MIKQQLGEPIEGEYPDAFVERYPQLTGAVKTTSASGQLLIARNVRRS